MPDTCFVVVLAYKDILLHYRRHYGRSSQILCSMARTLLLRVYLSDPYRGGEEAQPLFLMALHVSQKERDEKIMDTLAPGVVCPWTTPQ